MVVCETPGLIDGSGKLLYLFEECVVDTDRRELRRRANLIPLEPKVFDLLVHLIEQRERVISKDDLLASLWDGRVVSESALSTCINAARTAIGDNGDAQRLIRTLPRKGVRFVGDVREEQAQTGTVELRRPSFALPDRPSIAVLPFANLGVTRDRNISATAFPGSSPSCRGFRNSW
jgi:DNA-binding winged helix-turn-helix (wHTH) protein